MLVAADPCTLSGCPGAAVRPAFTWLAATSHAVQVYDELEGFVRMLGTPR